MAQFCAEISRAKAEIEQIRLEIQRIKQIKVCPSCGYENPSDASFCCKCSAALPVIPPKEEAAPAAGRLCPSCGAPASDTAQFCTKCGCKLQ